MNNAHLSLSLFLGLFLFIVYLSSLAMPTINGHNGKRYQLKFNINI